MVPLNNRFLQKMFPKIIPPRPDPIPLSNINFPPIPPKIINHLINKHNPMTLPHLIHIPNQQHINLLPSTITIHLLPLHHNQLLPDIQYPRLPPYLA
ncbi:DsrE/DsrF/DrsH-like family protein, partial [Bacillus altitudinis]|uniref:DsrE/DsrF/DrsH-like family protein n=1 Tax=Bacillus altitudinis TaxID=293387 RepID=UPI003B517221